VRLAVNISQTHISDLIFSHALAGLVVISCSQTTHAPQSGTITPVSRQIAQYFGIPIFLARVRPAIALWAPVPKATINENCHLLGEENEVRFPR
jgi:hypothetical protein